MRRCRVRSAAFRTTVDSREPSETGFAPKVVVERKGYGKRIKLEGAASSSREQPCRRRLRRRVLCAHALTR